MDKIKIYGYGKCSTCRQAVKFLRDRQITFEDIDITQQPPSRDILEAMLQQQGGKLQKLFNTSGKKYRELNLKDKLGQMDHDAALQLLSSDGMLVKRPILWTGQGGAIGFKPEVWNQILTS